MKIYNGFSYGAEWSRLSEKIWAEEWGRAGSEKPYWMDVNFVAMNSIQFSLFTIL